MFNCGFMNIFSKFQLNRHFTDLNPKFGVEHDLFQEMGWGPG